MNLYFFFFSRIRSRQVFHGKIKFNSRYIPSRNGTFLFRSILFPDVTPFPIVLPRLSAAVHVRRWQLAFRDVHACMHACMSRCSKRKTLFPANGGSRDAVDGKTRVPFTRWKRSAPRFVRDIRRWKIRKMSDDPSILFHDLIAIYSSLCFTKIDRPSRLSRILYRE